jgi:hypothetical protein
VTSRSELFVRPWPVAVNFSSPKTTFFASFFTPDHDLFRFLLHSWSGTFRNRNVPYLLHVSNPNPLSIPTPETRHGLRSSMSPTSANLCDCVCVYERVCTSCCDTREPVESVESVFDLSTPDRDLDPSLLKWARSPIYTWHSFVIH